MSVGQQQTMVGFDFGGQCLRIAAIGDESGSAIPHMISSRRMRHEIRYNGGHDGGRVFSLKRLLDVDETLALRQAKGAGISALEYLTQLFKSIRSDGALFPEGRVLNTAVAIPPCFSQRQRSVLRGALENSGFERVRLADDTLAVALANRGQLSGKGTVLVYSWGSSTFSAALYQPSGPTFRAVSQEGDRELGGDDLDAIVLNCCLRVVGRESHCLQEDDNKLLAELEEAKRALVEGREAGIATPTLLCPNHRTERMPKKIAVDSGAFRERFLQMVKRSEDLVEKVLKEGNCQNPEAVLLTGGLTTASWVRKALEQRFPARVLDAGQDAVALGAVLWGALLPEADWEASGRRVEKEKNRKARGAVEIPDQPPSPPSPSLAKPPRAAISTPPLKPESTPIPVPAEQAQRVSAWAANFLPLFNEAERLDREDRLDDAVAKIEELHTKLGKFFFLVCDKAAETQQARGNEEKALELLAKANCFDPANERVAHRLATHYAGRSVALFKSKRPEGAHEFALKALRVIERLPDAEHIHARALANCLRLLAQIHFHFKRPKEAESALERCLRLDPQQTEAHQMLEQIRHLLRQTARETRKVFGRMSGADRNQLCPCGSGEKYKKCCGR